LFLQQTAAPILGKVFLIVFLVNRQETAMNTFRQGDLLFIQVDTVPAGKPVRRENRRLILARGEQTGHAHAIVTPNVKLIEAFQEHYIVAPVPFEITHEEHATVAMPAGTFKVVHQREYSPQVIRRIVD